MIKYKPKPITIEAIRWTGRDEVLRALRNEGLKNYKTSLPHWKDPLYDLTIIAKARQVTVNVGDYVIKRPDGTFDKVTKEELEEFYNAI